MNKRKMLLGAAIVAAVVLTRCSWAELYYRPSGRLAEEINEARKMLDRASFGDPKCWGEACICGDVAFLEEMRKNGFSQLSDPECILKAAKYGQLECCKFLIAHGASVKAKGEYSGTVIHNAVRSGNLELCKYLIEQGAEVCGENHDDEPILHCAAQSGNFALYKYLIDHGVNEDLNKDGCELLYMAAIYGNLELCKHLIGKGVDVNAQMHGRTIIVHAAAEGNLEICKFMLTLKHGPAEVKNDEDGARLLHIAVEKGDIEFCKLLFAHGVSVMSRNVFGETALHRAAISGNVEMCKCLINQGADINAKIDESGETVIHFAARGGDLELCKYLIKRGADVKAKSKNGSTILYDALYSENINLCKYFIELGIDVKAQNNDGITVLLCAASRKAHEFVSYFISLGADVNGKDYAGRSALHYALLYEYSIIYGPTVLQHPNFEVCKCLIAHGADVNAKDNSGRTALHYFSKHAILTYDILDGGTDRNVADSLVVHDISDFLQFLIAAGIDINARDNSGQTALQYAATREDEKKCEALIKYGAKVKGLSFRCFSKNICKLLLKHGAKEAKVIPHDPDLGWKTYPIP